MAKRGEGRGGARKEVLHPANRRGSETDSGEKRPRSIDQGWRML
jgi:hypothetical protein